jgi:uncharacterized protein YlxP (DUF503 family)
MFVGVARLVLQIPGARSLKDRRQVVKSFKDRLRARLPVSVAEVGDVERYQVATLGVATVSGDASHCDEVLARATSMARSLGGAVLADVATEIVPFGTGGSGVRGGIEQAFSRLASDDVDRTSEPGEDDAQ